MKKLIWKLKFSYEMWRQIRFGLTGVCWDAACVWVEEQDWENWEPSDAAAEEIDAWRG